MTGKMIMVKIGREDLINRTTVLIMEIIKRVTDKTTATAITGKAEEAMISREPGIITVPDLIMIVQVHTTIARETVMTIVKVAIMTIVRVVIMTIARVAITTMAIINVPSAATMETKRTTMSKGMG
jgi:hypothetical protein